jgi:Na+-transporting NADH:ubiquinone oxidoreductase subunit NqrA
MKTHVEETFSLGNVIDINANSNLERVIRVIVLVKRFINNLNVRLEGKAAVLGALKVEETTIAECILINAAQASLKSWSDYQQLE